jgi:undecaprenyl-diphosphatase
VAQAFAVIPGVSRSGSTIAAGLFRNLERETAARFSFLLSTPIIGGAALKKIWDMHKDHVTLPYDERVAFLAGIIAAAISGAIVIQFFLHYLRRRSLDVFIWYRIVFGIIVFALATFFRLNGR